MSIDINGLSSNNAGSARQKSDSSRVGETDKTKQLQSNGAANASNSASGDKVSLSSEARVLQQAEGQLGNSSEVDMEKVDRIKAAIADGSFQPNSEEIAKKMLDMDDLF